MEMGKGWNSISRKYNIMQCTTEAHTPWQNEAERYKQEMMKMIYTILDHTGCKNYLWVMCAMYVVYLMNHLAKANLQWRSSHEVCLGVTPSISALLLFTFNECIYYVDT